MLNRTLNHYKVVARLGKGGMGEVWAAEDTKLGRKVALKVLPPEMAGNAERRARFEREAKAVAALNHPNIVTIHSVEEAEGIHFLTMELVDGQSLSEGRSGSPEISPDGKWIAVSTWDDETKNWAIDIIPFEGGTPRQRMDIPGSDEFRWAPDGLSLTVDVFDAGAENLFAYPLDGGERRQLTHFDAPWIGAFAWSPDGKQIVMARGTTETDVVLLRDFR